MTRHWHKTVLLAALRPVLPSWAMKCFAPSTGSSCITLVSASSYPFIGHHFTIMYMCADTPAFSPLSFSLQHIHDLKFLPVNRDVHPSQPLQHSAVHTNVHFNRFMFCVHLTQLPQCLINAGDACYALLPICSPMSMRNGMWCWGHMGKAVGWHSYSVHCSSDVWPKPLQYTPESSLTYSPLSCWINSAVHACTPHLLCDMASSHSLTLWVDMHALSDLV